MNCETYRVAPDTTVRLDAHDPSDKSRFPGSKRDRVAHLDGLNERLEELQELLWAERRHRILIVLQAMDTAGKDGTIRHVFDGTNPQGVQVANFKKPTPEELSHDFLWRIQKRTPGRGEIVIFNRSHYEDVLVVRVHDLVPPEVWSKRYAHINDFERRLADEGTTIIKFFLHISKEEQRERLQARLDEPHKRWKFSKGDLAERKRWDDYQEAYAEAISRTSTEWAPWYIVPANSKSYRNIVISRVLIDALEGLDMKYPEPEEDLDGIVVT